MKKKLASLAISACLALALVPSVAFAADFQDTEGHWAESAIDRWGGYGVVNGYGDSGDFAPDATLTRAEAAQIFTNLLQLDGAGDLSAYPDIDMNAWYVPAISACVDAGILNGVGGAYMEPDSQITREMFFVMFARALDLPEATVVDGDYPDVADISDWARGAMYALINAGYVHGVGGEVLMPTASIDRASAVALLDKSIVAYANASGETAVEGEGIVLVLAGDVALTGTDAATVVVAADGAAVDLSGMTGEVAVNVIADDVAIAGAAEGTVVAVAEGVTGTTVNDVAVTAGEDYVVPAEEEEPDPTPSTPGQGGSTGGSDDNEEEEMTPPDEEGEGDSGNENEPGNNEEEESGSVDNEGNGSDDSEDVA